MEEIIVSGIAYSVNEDGKTASVYGCIDKKIVDAIVVDSLRIGAGVYPVTGINEYAFLYCSQLKTIKFSTGLERIGSHAFCDCSALQTIAIPKSVTSIEGGIFAGCKNLNSIVVADGNPIYDSRENCNAIIETASNTLVQGCKATTIPDDIEAIGDFAFENTELRSIDIPNKVASIGESAFAGTNLQSVVLPENLKHIGNSAFCACKLMSIVIPRSVARIDGEILCGNIELCSIVVEEGNPIYDSRENCNAIIETASNTLVQGCNTSTVPKSVKAIGDRAFMGMGIQELVLPDGIERIGNEAFQASEITSINLPDSIKEIGEWAFSYSELKSVVIPKNLTNLLVNGENAVLSSCAALESIVVAEGNPVYDSRDNCNAIIETATNTLVCGCQNTIIPNSVTSIGNSAFFEINTLRAITIPENVRSIGNCAFSDCFGLESVEILGDLDFVGGFAFSDCENLVSLKVNNTTPFAIDDNTFDRTPIPNITLYVPKGSKSAYECDYYWSQFKEIVEF